MSSAVVSRRLAEGLVNLLAERRAEVNAAMESWRSAETDACAAREREAAALDAAHAAQLTHGEDAAELMSQAAQLQADARRAEYAARTARGPVGTAIADAEIDASNAQAKIVRMAPDDAALVERAAQETEGVARAARAELRLGPSPEDTARQRSAAWVAAQRVSASAVVQVPAAELERAALAPKPAWERLVVTDDERAVLDEIEYRLPRAAGAKMLRLLIAERGGLVAGKVIERNIGARPARELRRLPGPIAELVEAPGRDRRGYRLLGALATLATEGRLRP